MKTVNQVILTLSEADKFARSRNPHHHRLALLMLDNIIELQLRRKSETAFAFADMTWFMGARKHDRKHRKGVSRNHADLLAMAVSEKWITEDESNLLAFAHRLRNRAYHPVHCRLDGGMRPLDGLLRVLDGLFVALHFVRVEQPRELRDQFQFSSESVGELLALISTACGHPGQFSCAVDDRSNRLRGRHG